jgi:hypothetical protein
MAKEIPFEEQDSTGMYGHFMDMSSEKTMWNRDVALKFLAEADWLEELAEKYRHAAATLILEAQEFSSHTADLLAMEFPMKDSQESNEYENPDE